MITYKYKIYHSRKNRRLDSLLSEACFVWNHCLALQKRYYALYGKYVTANRMKTFFAKHYKMQHLHSQSVQEVIERLDLSYKRFFEHTAKRPPKFKRKDEMTSIVFKQGGFKIKGNRFTINKIDTTFKFSLSRPLRGEVRRSKEVVGKEVATRRLLPLRGDRRRGPSLRKDTRWCIRGD